MGVKEICDIVWATLIVLSIAYSLGRDKIKSKLAKVHKNNKKDSVVDKNNTKIDKISPVTTMTQKLMDLIIEAEKNIGYSSMEKLTFVLTNYHQYCIDNKIIYNEGIVTKCVEDLINLSKNVNQRDKDKEVTEVVDEYGNLNKEL